MESSMEAIPNSNCMEAIAVFSSNRQHCSTLWTRVDGNCLWEINCSLFLLTAVQAQMHVKTSTTLIINHSTSCTLHCKFLCTSDVKSNLGHVGKWQRVKWWFSIDTCVRYQHYHYLYYFTVPVLNIQSFLSAVLDSVQWNTVCCQRKTPWKRRKNIAPFFQLSKLGTLRAAGLYC